MNTSGLTPQPRMGHVAVLIGNNIMIQGGFYFDEVRHQVAGLKMGTLLKESYLNDLRVLDTDTFV